MHRRALMDKINNAPMSPGCYLYRDVMGNVIYVGKAKLLRNRVRQYFGKRREDDSPKLENLVRVIADVEYRVTHTERDALMLEYRLIKQYRPWFNAQLVSEPRQWFLRIDRRAARPTLSACEHAADDGADYFGSFRDRYDAQEAIELLGAVWHTPTCGKTAFDPAGRPCVQHEVGSCMAPCGGAPDAQAYRAATGEIAAVLQGERPPVFQRLEADMRRCAATMNYESASRFKHQIEQLERLRSRSRFMARFPDEGDVLVFLRAYREDAFSLFLVRNGAVIARAEAEHPMDPASLTDHLECAMPPADADWIPNCLIELYADKLFVPVSAGPDALREAVSAGCERFGRKSEGTGSP